MFEVRVRGFAFNVLGFWGTRFHDPVSWFSGFVVTRSGFSAYCGLGFRVGGFRCFVVWCFVFGVQGFAFGVRGSRVRSFRGFVIGVRGFAFGVSGLVFRVGGSGFRVRGSVSCSGFS